jgi:hypothetical protein
MYTFLFSTAEVNEFGGVLLVDLMICREEHRGSPTSDGSTVYMFIYIIFENYSPEDRFHS